MRVAQVLSVVLAAGVASLLAPAALGAPETDGASFWDLRRLEHVKARLGGWRQRRRQQPRAALAAPASPPCLARCAVQRLLAQKEAIINWAEFAASNNITGWQDGTPVCSWTGVTCGVGGDVLSL